MRYGFGHHGERVLVDAQLGLTLVGFTLDTLHHLTELLHFK